MFEGLRGEIESLVVPVDGDALAEAFGLYDQFAARLCESVGQFDAAGLWEVDGATSMTAWLADRARMVRRRAAGWASRARKLVGLPVTARAYGDGVLSSGQVEAICANVDRETVGLFGEHEAEIVPTLAALSVDEVAIAMRRWREHATADREPKPERPQELHLSRGLDSGWRLDGNLNAETGELLETAWRLAGTGEVEGDVPRSNATRRADHCHARQPDNRSKADRWIEAKSSTCSGSANCTTLGGSDSATGDTDAPSLAYRPPAIPPGTDARRPQHPSWHRLGTRPPDHSDNPGPDVRPHRSIQARPSKPGIPGTATPRASRPRTADRARRRHRIVGT